MVSSAQFQHPARVTPPPKRLSTLEAYFVSRRNVLEVPSAQVYDERITRKSGILPWTMLADPPWIEHVLKTRAKDYPRSNVTRRILQPTRGENLFTAEWDDWRFQHRALAPIFQHKNLMALTRAMTVSADDAVKRLAKKSGQVVDIADKMTVATFDVINATAFSGRQKVDRERLVSGFERLLATIAKPSILDFLDAPRWVPRPAQLFDRSWRNLDALMDQAIQARMAGGPNETPDLLDLLIAAEDPETGRRMTPEEVRNNLMVFIIAGHETTALALTWAIYLLALDQTWRRRIRDEAQSVLGDGPATAEHLRQLPLTRQVLDEALRLYPPAGFLSRTATCDDDEIAGVPVARGETIFLPIYALHRHRQLWDHPDEFDPTRFEASAIKSRHRYQYIPFGAGPRICIGMQFALMEATIILSTLMARFDFVITPDTQPKPVLTITLRAVGGMPLKINRL